MDGNVLRAKSSNDLLVESLVSAPADNGRSGEGVPTLSESEHLKRDISSGGITVHIDADIKVPKITGDIRTYSAQYRFFDLLELEDLFFSGDDPMFNPGSEKTAEDDPSAGLPPGRILFRRVRSPERVKSSDCFETRLGKGLQYLSRRCAPPVG